ncbi:MAG: HAMP domain-containing histidine kinase [Phycisphaerales bacterium]|nr:HAMP domain-containing histidine kinase [Phycisphaerales bacterium]
MADETELKLTSMEDDGGVASVAAPTEPSAKPGADGESTEPGANGKPGANSFSLKAGRLTLPLKTTIILAILLVGAVVLCGGIFLKIAENMLNENKHTQLSQLAYALSSTLGNEDDYQSQLDALRKTSNFEFAVITDEQMHISALFVDNMDAWRAYSNSRMASRHTIASDAGHVQKISYGDNKVSHVLSVPVLHTSSTDTSKTTDTSKATDTPKAAVAYLHVGSGGESILAQLQFLQAGVLFTCMGMVLLVVPIASLVARHLTVPIQQLARGAHALAGGDLAHRVLIRRSDELGELAFAFNHMADTVQRQQEDIQQINANLEQMIEDRTAQLQRANHRLTAEIAEKEDFLRAVSHDLNAPLRNIAGMTSMLMMKYGATLEKDAIQRLERIQTNVATQSELINELLELSRIRTRREKIEQVDLHELLTAVADSFAGDIETKRITLTINGRLPVMKCEKARLRQVFQNLIDNAIKYMREDGPRTIGVSVRWEPQEVVISVEDTGMGIAANEIANLFHVFRRAKNAAMMKIPGKGVGLASVKAIVENYHGRLWAESQAGQGTTFHMAIPRTHFELAQQEVA